MTFANSVVDRELENQQCDQFPQLLSLTPSLFFRETGAKIMVIPPGFEPWTSHTPTT